MHGGKVDLRVLNGGELKVAFFVVGDGTLGIERGIGSDGEEFPTCGSDRGGLKGTHFPLKGIGDFMNDGGDLGNVMDLTVEHGARLMLLAFGGNDGEGAVVLLDGDYTDDGAGTYVERINLFSI